MSLTEEAIESYATTFLIKIPTTEMKKFLNFCDFELCYEFRNFDIKYYYYIDVKKFTNASIKFLKKETF